MSKRKTFEIIEGPSPCDPTWTVAVIERIVGDGSGRSVMMATYDGIRELLDEIEEKRIHYHRNFALKDLL